MGKSHLMVKHRFFCINCGQEGIPITRKVQRLKGVWHRKKMYCPWCREIINHIECYTDDDVTQFKEEFEKGMFKDEAEKSLSYVRGTRSR